MRLLNCRTEDNFELTTFDNESPTRTPSNRTYEPTAKKKSYMTNY